MKEQFIFLVLNAEMSLFGDVNVAEQWGTHINA
jgi:hypothetical protein